MPKVIVTYDATDEIAQITKFAEKHADMKMEESDFKKELQKMFQDVFNEGRRLQKQLSCPSNVKDIVSSKADI